MNRRQFLALCTGGAAALLAGSAGAMSIFGGKSEKSKKEFPYTLSEAEWRAKLTPEQYRVMRGEGTEAPHSCPLNTEKRNGTFYCAGCGQALFASHKKYDSGTGWPSFGDPVSPEAVGTSVDYKLGYPRTEVHCGNCGSHLGHVFEDGPPPSGLRYCMNGVALTFTPDPGQ